MLETAWKSRRVPDPGVVAQLGERNVRNVEVEGSIPFISTSESCNRYEFAERIQALDVKYASRKNRRFAPCALATL